MSLDIRKPLRRGMKVKKPGEEWYWVNYKYERLPTFCYFCGMLGHSKTLCETMSNRSLVKDPGEKWLWTSLLGSFPAGPSGTSNGRVNNTQKGREQMLEDSHITAIMRAVNMEGEFLDGEDLHMES